MEFIHSLARQAAIKGKAPSLQKGQFLRGRVVEVLPKNEAIVQHGQQKVSVQVQSHLTKGSSYLFHVEKVDPVLSLKVVPLSSLNDDGQEPIVMLKQLDVDITKTNINFLKDMLELNVPFHKKELLQAFRLMKNEENLPLAKEVLLHMIKRRLPITPSIFYALMTKHSTGFSQILSEVHQHIYDGDQTQRNLLSHVERMQGRRSFNPEQLVTSKILREIQLGQTYTYELFKKAEITDRNETYATFQQKWSIPSKDKNQLTWNTSSFPVSLDKVLIQLKHLFHQQIPLTLPDKKAIQQWIFTSDKVSAQWNSNDVAANMRSVPTPLIKTWTNQLKDLGSRKIPDRLDPYLEESSRSTLHSLIEQSTLKEKSYREISRNELQSLVVKLRSLIQRQLAPDQMRVLTSWLDSTRDLMSLTEKDRILLQLKTMLDLPGYSDENKLSTLKMSQGTFNQEDSIKSLLLQMGGDKSDMRTETGRRLLHLINGIQLSSYSDHGQLVQLALQFPGSIIGARNDVHLNMEGHKTKNGEVDPDYCHILFFLNLSELKETVIDLNITDRRVSVLVFNENADLENLFEPYKVQLEEGLKHLGYTLTSVRSSAIKVDEERFYNDPNTDDPGGVDLRI